MSCKVEKKRRQERFLDTTTERATIPAEAQVCDFTQDTDIMKAEFVFNLIDDSLQSRTDNGIRDIPLLDGSAGNDGKLVGWDDANKRFTFQSQDDILAALGSGADKHVSIWSGTNSQTSDANLQYDYNNDILLVGSQAVTSTNYATEIAENSRSGVLNLIQSRATGDNTALKITTSGAADEHIGIDLTVAGATENYSIVTNNNASSIFARGVGLSDPDDALLNLMNSPSGNSLTIGLREGGGHLSHTIKVADPRNAFTTAIGGDMYLQAGNVIQTGLTSVVDGGFLYLRSGKPGKHSGSDGDSSIILQTSNASGEADGDRASTWQTVLELKKDQSVKVSDTYTLPTDAGTDTYVLTTDGVGGTSWAAASAGTPAGADTQVQFNDAGAFGASADFTYDGSSLVLGSSISAAARLHVQGSGTTSGTSAFLVTNSTPTTTMEVKDNGSGLIALGLASARKFQWGAGYIENTSSTFGVSVGAGTTYESLYLGVNHSTGTSLARRVQAIGSGHSFATTGTVSAFLAVGESHTIQSGQNGISVGQSITHVSGEWNALLGNGIINTGSYNTGLGQVLTLTGSNIQLIGQTLSTTQSNVTVVGRNLTLTSTLFAEGFYATYSDAAAQRPTFGVVKVDDPNNDAGSTTSDNMNIAWGSNNIARKDGTLGAASVGAGAGVMWVGHDVDTIAPQVNMTNALAIWAKDRVAGETGLAFEFESGVNNFLGDRNGFGVLTPTAFMHYDSGNFDEAAWGTAGIASRWIAGTYEDNSTAASGTVTNMVIHSFAQPTFDSTNGGSGTEVTATYGATLYVEGAPLAVTNKTIITNPYAVWVDDGIVQVDYSIIVGNPTGGDKGAGSINAEAVYDDNVLLTDYVFDHYYDGQIREKDIRDRPGLSDYRLYSLEECVNFVYKHRHLPTIGGRKEWADKGKASLGDITTQLWETVETHFIYISQLKEEIEQLKLT